MSTITIDSEKLFEVCKDVQAAPVSQTKAVAAAFAYAADRVMEEHENPDDVSEDLFIFLTSVALIAEKLDPSLQ